MVFAVFERDNTNEIALGDYKCGTHRVTNTQSHKHTHTHSDTFNMHIKETDSYQN